MTKLRSFRPLLAAALASLLLLTASCNSQKQANPATEFSFKTASGQTESTAKYLGKPLVVNFWADWCPPCVAELPDLNASYEAHKGEFNMIAVSSPTSQDAEGFWKSKGYSIPMFIDIDGNSKFSIQYIPTTLFIDAKGNLVDTATGGMTKEDFETRLTALLK